MSVESYRDLAVAESSYRMSHNACINVSIVRYWPNPAVHASISGCQAEDSVVRATGRSRPIAVMRTKMSDDDVAKPILKITDFEQIYGIHCRFDVQ
jgi:hypothetical protein